ncbi:hypothetical protein [Bifidobacterium sp.]|jgi:hypothetical protein|uniref:hypothetical protein n=1 Tax=Bifidobacterium sp. TaxID=41200 RepID=UPI0025C6AD30|nr:hypothetical protein [Bifidobacterium sp.]MCH4208583.1 hypothetical protein [Bifidobacterium sp.]MCI1224269.1 hypothetical protein [Bifidobacterium sp.]
MDKDMTIFPERASSSPAAKDGFIRLELSNAPVAYHLIWAAGEALKDSDCNALAMRSCRIACLTADVIRGRPVAHKLRNALSEGCLKRLEVVSHLLDNHLRMHQELRAQMHRFPVIPLLLEGMFVARDKLEMTVCLCIGPATYWANLVLRTAGNRWLCVYADIG